MSEKEIDYEKQMIDELEASPHYQRAIADLDEKSTHILRKSVHGFLSDFANKFLNKITENVNNEEFRKAFKKEIERMMKLSSKKESK